MAREYAFVQVDVFTDRDLRRQPAGRVPRRARPRRRRDAGDRARDEPVGDDLRAAGHPAGVRGARPHLHAGARGAVRRPSRPSAPRGCWPPRAGSGRQPLRARGGHRPGARRSRGRPGAAQLRVDAATGTRPSGPRSTTARASPPPSGLDESDLQRRRADRPGSTGNAVPLRPAPRPRDGRSRACSTSGACRPPSATRRSLGIFVFAPDPTRPDTASTRGCSRRTPRASRRTPPPARPAARSAPTSCCTGS